MSHLADVRINVHLNCYKTILRKHGLLAKYIGRIINVDSLICTLPPKIFFSHARLPHKYAL